MKVKPAQLEPGCLVIKDVMGKTNRPIIPKNTIIQPVHIKVLKKFKIQTVEISNRRSDGAHFVVEAHCEEEGTATSKANSQQVVQSSFQDQYLEAVQSYKTWFTSWQGGVPIDMKAIRRVMVPLLERVVDSKREVFNLHHFTSSQEYIYHHSVAMGLLSGYLAAKMGYNYGEWIQIGLAGLLADTGMAKMDKHITGKEGPLTEGDFDKIKTHPTYSYKQVQKIPSLSNQAKIAVLQHHERLDGTGYPLGIQTKIHPFSQIIAVSDMYHAMTSERKYRRKQSPYKVLEEIIHEQFGRYDHKVIGLLVKEMTHYSTGTKIRLSDNQDAEVIFVEKTHPTRPLVKLEENGKILSLKEHRGLHIEEVYE
ncbi:HD-GYP domain, c-di-GMP phosphodiesterase class II (or its inactivated variant) [Halobacillus dabanensis]|uniref:HD-GYP domain, c-di-GMP phosphodiesterase class II (Or its inactivated variant) n=1 Tax=Halobacillus dabanensis TaxID=240302 RepID=A0A1I3WY72_HALDA|nr:HD-GYP domain-containing protein [Halobacillus dabanensis]SFK11867.1 HD-GYP domain, c-di-GMP phosphodiesterase class II (or its inactivated variant) [Halobacillus dabanensis]